MNVLPFAVMVFTRETAVLAPTQVLQRLEVGQQLSEDRKPEIQPAVYRDLRRRIKEFASRTGTLAPVEAAKEWVQLLDAYFKPEPQTYLAVKPEECLRVIPGPEAWPFIAADLRIQPLPPGQPEAVTLEKRLLADVLSRDTPAQRADLKGLAKASEKSDLTDFIARVECGLASVSGDPGWILSAFRNFSDNGGRDYVVPMPNLSDLVGKRRAEEELRHLILNGSGTLFISNDSEDRKLVDRLLPKLVKGLSDPPWQLITSPAVALKVMPYAMKKWPDHGGREGDTHGTAKLMYCVGLEEAGRTKAAAQLAAKLVWDGDYEYWAPVGHDQAMFSIYSKLAKHQADLVYWDDFLNRVKNSGEVELGLHLLARTSSSKHTDPDIKDQLVVPYSLALIRSGQLRKGVMRLRTTVGKQLTVRSSEDGYVHRREAERLVMPSETLARIGAALHNAALEETAIRTLIHVGPMVEYDVDDPAECLLELGRARDAQEVALSKDPDTRINTNNLEFLASIYYHENRPRDLLEFVNKCPYWRAGDVAEIDEDREVSFSPRLSFMVSWALSETGETARSFRVLEPALHRQGVSDAEFDLLLRLKGTASIDILSELANEDQFSSSALVWKAIAYNRFGDLDRAATTLREAIELDPWGIGRPKGGRSRARRALAWVLKRQGRVKEATKLERQVNALKLEEAAEKLSELGLANLADSKFRQSLRMLPKCFITHYRYAQCLASQGFRDEAASQWSTAFENLPAGVGRRHNPNELLGDLFESDLSRDSALKVLMRYGGPEKAKARYWLGELYKRLDRPEDARNEFWRASQLDPSDFDSWCAVAQETATTWEDHLHVLTACKAITRLAQKAQSVSLGEEMDTSYLDMKDMAELCLAAENSHAKVCGPPANTYALFGSTKYAEPQPPFWSGGETKFGAIVARSSVLVDVFLLMDRISEHSSPAM